MDRAIEKKIERIRAAGKVLLERARACDLCPRACGVDRLAGELGYCRAPAGLFAAATCVHHGEEPFISGSRGSGTLFFSHCNLRCVFCQNYQISHLGRGRTYPAGELAECMLELARGGAHNINLVSPTPYLPWILEALEIACLRGLAVPLVYNTHGYESTDVIELLEGIVDVYLPDLKYADAEAAHRYSSAPDYPETGRRAVTAMYDQVGLLAMNGDSIAGKGLIVRHLVLPNHVQNSRDVLDFIATLDPAITVSIMSQYFPGHRAGDHPAIGRPVSEEEYEAVVNHAIDLGLDNSLVQELESSDNYLPDFGRDSPFEQNKR